jgi:hypothetical protein
MVVIRRNMGAPCIELRLTVKIELLHRDGLLPSGGHLEIQG